MPPPERAYLDWNASAPLRPAAREALLTALDLAGNPSSPHREGRLARDAVESARTDVALLMGCAPAEVVFTSGGTEANNLALHALAGAARQRSFAAARVEHASVLRPLEVLERQGWDGHWLAVTEEGAVAAASLDRTAGFAVLQAANQETGTVQDVPEFGRRADDLNVPWHCDAVQLWGKGRLALGDLGCATASLSGHKLGAPKGVGALYTRAGTPFEPQLRGGEQERRRRAGTENVPGIVALGAACRALLQDLESDLAWMQGLRERIEQGARGAHELVVSNGPDDPGLRLPNTASLSFPGLDAELLVQSLDLEGVAVSAGSACTSGAVRVSPVLTAMGLPEWRVRGAVRVSVGPSTRPQEVDAFCAALARVVSRLRAPASAD